MLQLKLLDAGARPRYDLSRHRLIWQRITAWTRYVQKAKVSGMRLQYAEFQRIYDAGNTTSGRVTSPANREEAVRRISQVSLPSYSNITSGRVTSASNRAEAVRRMSHAHLPPYTSARSTSVTATPSGDLRVAALRSAATRPSRRYSEGAMKRDNTLS